MKLNKLITLSLIVIAIASSCKKENGYGGNSAVKGTLKEDNYNFDYTSLEQTAVKANDYVYIIFKEGNGYGDRVKTSYDGSFSFTHLKPGDYTVYAYSKDSTMQSAEEIIVSSEFTISKKKEIIDIGELKIANNKQAKGNAIIQGKIIAHDQNDAFTYDATNKKVYLKKVGAVNYQTYTYTNENGNYLFPEIAVGSYKVYTYSKDYSANATNPNTVEEQEIEIHTNTQNEILSDFHIYN